MNRTQKKETIEGLNRAFQDSDLVIITHNNGLNASQTDTLRRTTRAAGIKCRVAKNRLVQIALKGTAFEGAANLFTGPTVMLMGDDLVTVAKTAANFAKDNPAFVIVGGATRTDVMDAAAINTLATLPTMDELRGKLIGLLQAPGAQLARLAQAYADKG